MKQTNEPADFDWMCGNGTTENAWHLLVVIPACNEEDLLPRCLQSILTACDALPFGVTHDIVVVCDSCEDGTGAIAQRLLRDRGTVLDANARSAGSARALGVRRGLSRYRGPRHHCWIANTDADCAVPSTWLNDQLRLAERGVAGFAGTVDVDNYADHGPEVAARFKASYEIRPDGSHPHVHGANLGVRADAYLKAGGWADLQTAEDHDLWNRLRDAHCPTVSTSRIEVLTSGRLIGRAPHGFAGALAAHGA